MPILLAVAGLFFPRLLIVVLYLFTGWFNGILDNLLYLILGLIFLPFSTLWYGVVFNYFGGNWDTVSTVGIVIAVGVDLGFIGGSRKKLF